MASDQTQTQMSNAAGVRDVKMQHTGRRRRGLLRWLDLSQWVHHETLVEQLPLLLLLTLLGLLYIGNAHLAEAHLRKLHALEKKLEELNWAYTVQKAEWDNLMRQSQIVRLAAPMGLRETLEPPQLLREP